MAWVNTSVAGTIIYTHDATNARITFTDIYPISRGLEAFVALYPPESTMPITFGRKDLTYPESRQRLADDANKVNNKIPWREGLDAAVWPLLALYSGEETVVDLAAHVPAEQEWVLEPFLEVGGHTRLIAPGGSGKSMFALAIGLAVATGSSRFVGTNQAPTPGPVLYLDWETDADTHARRVKAICKARGVAPPTDMLLYQQMTVPFYRATHRIKQIVEKYGVVLIIIDSNAMARGASGEGSAEDSTLRLFSALREINVTALLVDHKSREMMLKKKKGGYGSVFNTNTVRLEWEMSRFRELSPTVSQFVLSLEKANNTRAGMKVAYAAQILGVAGQLDSIKYEKIDPLVVLEDSEVVADRIASLLASRDEPLSVKVIADLLGEKEATVRAKLNGDGRFVNVGSGRLGLWRLADGPRDDGAQTVLPDPF